jgi:hypothetical protein
LDHLVKLVDLAILDPTWLQDFLAAVGEQKLA